MVNKSELCLSKSVSCFLIRSSNKENFLNILFSNDWIRSLLASIVPLVTFVSLRMSYMLYSSIFIFSLSISSLIVFIFAVFSYVCDVSFFISKCICSNKSLLVLLLLLPSTLLCLVLLSSMIDFTLIYK